MSTARKHRLARGGQAQCDPLLATAVRSGFGSFAFSFHCLSPLVPEAGDNGAEDTEEQSSSSGSS